MTGKQIKDARERAQLTQQELASKIGVGMRTIGNWERGETVPKNRMAALEAFFTDTRAVASQSADDDPIRSASDAELLAELQRRAALRDRSVS